MVFKRLFGSSNDTAQADYITVVSGLPRSGTSMMMKMLEAGGISPVIDNIRTADADNPKGYYEFERVKQLDKGDTAWLPEAKGKTVKVIATLLPYLPAGYEYRVIFMRRAMPEILASQRKMLVRRGEDPNKISDEELTMLFEAHLKHVDKWIAEQASISRLDVNYNELLADPAPQIAKIASFLGEGIDTGKMAGVIDPQLYRQRKSR